MASAKRSISFDPEVLATAERVAREEYGGNLSELVNAAVEHRVKLRLLKELLAEMDEEFGPVPDEIKAEIDAEVAEWESRSTPAR